MKKCHTREHGNDEISQFQLDSTQNKTIGEGRKLWGLVAAITCTGLGPMIPHVLFKYHILVLHSLTNCKEIRREAAASDR